MGVFKVTFSPYLITGIFLVISGTQITQRSFFVCASSYNSHFYYPDQLKHFIKGQKKRKIVKLEMEMVLINDWKEIWKQMIQFITFFHLVSIFVFDSSSVFYSSCFDYTTICSFSPQPCKTMGEICIKLWMGKMNTNSRVCHSFKLGQINSVCERFFPAT